MALADPSRAAEPPSGPLVFAGCGSNVPITQRLVQAFAQVRPGIEIDVRPIGSTNGIWVAAAGAIPVGLVSRPLTEPERGLGLTIVPYARTALVIGANRSVAADGITSEDLAQIYAGGKSRWGDGRSIAVVAREPGDSSIQVLSREIPGFREAYADGERTRRWAMLYSEQQMNRLLASRESAIGLSDLGALTTERLAIKALKVNGVPPTLENVATGRYPLVKTLAFVFRHDNFPQAQWRLSTSFDHRTVKKS